MWLFESRRPRRRGAVVFAGALTLVLLVAIWPLDRLRADFQQRIYRDREGKHKYTVFVPAGYTPAKKWPVILYLHGASTRGNDNQLQLVDGLAPIVRAKAASFPFVVVFPQCEDTNTRLLEGWLASTPDARRALKILDAVEGEFNIDRDHEILTGLSMGGYGASSIAAATPERWSAVVVVSGGGDPSQAPLLKDVPIWSVHGSKDLAVRTDDARQIIEAVQSAGGRAYFTDLPGDGHYIGHIVYGEEALYSWMLNPKSEPAADKMLANARRPVGPQDLSFDRIPFAPAVEIPQSVYVHADNQILESLAEAFPDLLPGRVVSGAMDNVFEGRRAGPFRFRIVLAGLTYRGELDTVEIKTRDDGWVTLNLGLRDLTMEVGSTQVSGRLAEATAGPMDIVIGHQRPVWLSVELQPRVENRELRFSLGNIRFQIEDDNWYVTRPRVGASGLPIVRGRLAAAVSRNLVGQTYARKPEIEARVIASAPELVRQLEKQSAQQFDMVRTLGDQAMPTDLPRFKLWPNRLKVDGAGISMILGITLAHTGARPPRMPVQVIDGGPIRFEDMPKLPGLIRGFSGGIVQAVTTIRIADGSNTLDIRDLKNADLLKLQDRRTLVNLIPGLNRYGEELQVRTLMTLIEPVTLSGTTENPGADRSATAASTSEIATAPGSSAAETRSSRRLTDGVEFNFSNARMIVEIKPSPYESQWVPYAEFDLKIKQRFLIRISRLDFANRALGFNADGPAEISVAGRFIGPYRPSDTTIQTDEVTRILRQSWESGALLVLLRELRSADVSLGTCKLRVSEAGWCDPFTVQRYVPATTRITNNTGEPLQYSVRGPHTVWGGPHTLEPGHSDDFSAPYPVTIRQSIAGSENIQTPPMGTRFLLGENPKTSSPAASAGAEPSERRD